MIFPISSQVFWTYVAVPVWQREPTPAAPAPPAFGPCADADGVEVASAPEPEPEPEPRLVFKGYEWRPVARWDPFVNPGFDHWVDNDPDEIRERQLRADRERRQDLVVDPAQRAAPTAPDAVPGVDAAAGPAAGALPPNPR